MTLSPAFRRAARPRTLVIVVEVIELVWPARVVRRRGGLLGGSRLDRRDLDGLLLVRFPGLVLLPAVQPLRGRRERYQSPSDEDGLDVVLLDADAGCVSREPGGNCACERGEHERCEHSHDTVRRHGLLLVDQWIDTRRLLCRGQVLNPPERVA
jgi:hypothetical protein